MRNKKITATSKDASAFNITPANKKNNDLASEEFIDDAAEIGDKLKYSYEVAASGVWDWDIEHDVITVHLFDEGKDSGTPPMIIGGKEAWTNRIHPDDIDSVLSKIRECVNGVSPFYQSKHRMRMSSGEFVWALDQGKVVSRSNDGKALRMVGAHNNITSKHKEQSYLQMLQTCAARLNDMVMICAAADKSKDFPLIVYVNEAFERITGYQAKDIIGKSPDFLHGPRTQLDILDKIRFSLAVYQPIREDIINYTKSGEEIWMEMDIMPVTDMVGKYTHWIAIERDITERKKSELCQVHHNQIYEMLDNKAPAKEVFEKITRNINQIFPKKLCAIVLLEDGGKRLSVAAAPDLPRIYSQAIEGLMIDRGGSAISTAINTRKQVIVENLLTYPGSIAIKELVIQVGLGSCWYQPIISSDGSMLGVFAIYHRVPRKPTADNFLLLESEARLIGSVIDKIRAESKMQLAASVFTHSREGIVISSPSGEIVEVNEMFSHITGFSRKDVIGKKTSFLNSGQQNTDFYEKMNTVLKKTGYWHGELYNCRKNNDPYIELNTTNAVLDKSGKVQHYVSFFTDITKVKEYKQQLERVAHYDPLTGLPNRALLADRMKQSIAQCERREQSMAVIYLDIDGFKLVNDVHGHDMGDKLLIIVAQRMKAALRDMDTLARIGGDEFVVVLIDVESSINCDSAITRLLRAASEPVIIGDLVMQVSASLGVTIYPQDGSDVDLLLRHADQAMYQAKQAGKNRFHMFDVAQDTAVKTNRDSLVRIREALENNEFVLFYQPKVNMLTGEVIGVEALIRWQHPDRGILPPAAFLLITENHPISIDIGNWVIDTALMQMSTWQKMGLHLGVSVNVGARQLQHPDFVKGLVHHLSNHTDVNPSSLELEILETSALEDITQVSDIMIACQLLGVQFALDDFGTGYSSLTYLKHLPAELLKIDQSFIRDMLEDADDLAIVKGVVGLASAFRRNVIAEGVETIAHGSKLLPLGCVLGQGYGIARPMPAASIPEWVRTWRPDPSWIV